jgi:hypothetical protein
MDVWAEWKKGFDAWEGATAQYLEHWLRSPLVLGPAGAMLTALFKTRAAGDQALEAWWSALGLPTRRDQERSLHALNQLQSRILDLEEALEDLRARAGHPAEGATGAGAVGRPARGG